MSPPAPAAVVEAYRAGVVAEVTAYGRYFAKQLKRYRFARILVIVSAALVPVLSAVQGTPRWVLGVLGAIAAVTESLIQLYRWRDAALNAQRMGNAMESELTRYTTGAEPYADDATAFALFVDRVEKVRASGADAFAGLWAEDKPPASQAGPPATQPGAQTPTP